MPGRTRKMPGNKEEVQTDIQRGSADGGGRHIAVFLKIKFYGSKKRIEKKEKHAGGCRRNHFQSRIVGGREQEPEDIGDHCGQPQRQDCGQQDYRRYLAAQLSGAAVLQALIDVRSQGSVDAACH